MLDSPRSTSFVPSLLLPAVACLSLALPATAQCVTQRVSVDSSGAEATGGSGTGSPNVHRNFLSADGRLVVFWSDAPNLVPNDTNGVADVFLRDLQTGTTTRLSLDSSGIEGNGPSTDPAICADGRLVVFQSAATNLVANDTNGKIDVFVRDTVLGTTIRASVDSLGNAGDGDSTRPDIAANGRFVVFQSKATSLAAADTNAFQDVYVRDLVASTTNCLSVDSTGVVGNALSGAPAISANGRWIAFHSNATNLVANDTNLQTDVFVRDRQTFTTTRVSTNALDEQTDYFSQTPSISADGRYVAFSSTATNLVASDTNNLFDVFVKDRTTGLVRRVSEPSGGGQGNNTSQGNSISADGRFVAFVSYASNLVPNDTNGGPFGFTSDVFVHDVATNTTNRLSVDGAGIEGNQAGSSYNACVSLDGSSVAFYSGATNLAPGGDNNGVDDVFVRSCGGPPAPVGMCAGDGSGTACPCGNSGAAGHGCENSLGTGGGLLSATGSSSVSNDSFTLIATSMPATTPVLFFQGDATLAGGAGVPFGDGLRCAGGSVFRLGVRLCVAGTAQVGAAVPTDPRISVTGFVPPGIVTFRYYQGWYRNNDTYCTADLYNLTNGLKITWIP